MVRVPKTVAGLFFIVLAAFPAKVISHKAGARVRQDAAERAAVQRWMRTMTLRDKAAQLVVMPFYGEPVNVRSETFRHYRHWVQDLRIGGMIVLGHRVNGTIRLAEPYALAAFTNRMQKMSKVPLLFGADFERGPAFRVRGAAAWPHNMAFAAARDVVGVQYEGAATARESRALGIQWVFAPDADVNSNPDNPIINIRSYGEDPAEVGRYVEAYIAGAHSDRKYPVLVTVKHFPGHGNTSEDSHLGLPKVGQSRQQLEQVDLLPFRDAIAAGVDAVMTAHLSVPAIETQEIPATVSAAVLTGLLRDEMNFHGLVVTDAMDMQGLTKFFTPSEASVRAIEAGADVLLMPRNAGEAIRGVVKAVESGRISRKRLDESVTKVLAAKVRVGLNRKSRVDLDNLGEVFNSPEDQVRAQEVADRAVTLVKDDEKLVPLNDVNNTCLTVLAESRNGTEGRHLMDEFGKRAPKMKMQLLDPAMSAGDLNHAASGIGGCGLNVVAAYVTISEYRGNTALAGDYPSFLNQVIAGKAPVILVAIGSPYAARDFPKVNAYMTTYSTASTSETAAVKALFGEIPINGKLPVTIPEFAKYGDGISVPAKGGVSSQ